MFLKIRMEIIPSYPQWSTWIFVVILTIAPISGSAQKTSSRDRGEAAVAYDRGTAAYVSGNYKKAAHWFEHANRLIPAPAALVGAAKAYVKLGKTLKAANLALRLTTDFPDDPKSQRFAQAIVVQASKMYVRIDAQCHGACDLEIDGALTEQRLFFASPNTSHQVVATFQTGTQSRRVLGSAGAKKIVPFDAPPVKISASAHDVPGRSKPVPTWAFWSTAGVTVALGAVTLWSAIDMKMGVDAYERAAAIARSPGSGDAAKNEAKKLLKDGQKREKRSLALTAMTGTLTIGTVLIGVFTNFSGAKERAQKKLRPSIGIASDAGHLMLEGRF